MCVVCTDETRYAPVKQEKMFIGASLSLKWPGWIGCTFNPSAVWMTYGQAG